MTYLIFSSKTSTADGVFVGTLEAINFAEAKKAAKKLNYKIVYLASVGEINWLKNDSAVRVLKISSLPSNFNLLKANKLS